jgi:hypothetical protein
MSIFSKLRLPALDHETASRNRITKLLVPRLFAALSSHSEKNAKNAAKKTIANWDQRTPATD